MNEKKQLKRNWEVPIVIALDESPTASGNCTTGSVADVVGGYWVCHNGNDTGMPGGCVVGGNTRNHECSLGGNTSAATGHNCLTGEGWHG
jgi:hypothetical protein